MAVFVAVLMALRVAVFVSVFRANMLLVGMFVLVRIGCFRS